MGSISQLQSLVGSRKRKKKRRRGRRVSVKNSVPYALLALSNLIEFDNRVGHVG